MAGFPTPLPPGFPSLNFAGFWGPEPISDRFGNGLVGAYAFIFYSDEETPALVYNSEVMNSPATNPVQVDQNANLSFWAHPGAYHVKIIDDTSVELTSFNVMVPINAAEVSDRINTLETTAYLTKLQADGFYLGIDDTAEDSNQLQGRPAASFSDEDHDHDERYTYARVGGQNIWVQPTEPTALEVGDIWIKSV